MHTALHGLLQAVAWPSTLLTLSSAVDNAWAVALERSSRAGEVLAEVLAGGAHGDRPVTLVGYSLGARVVYACLRELARRRLPGVVEMAVLMGAPVALDQEKWAAARSAVAGRLVCVYSRSDWLLGAMYRVGTLQRGCAGLQAVGIPGVESVDATDLIETHTDYRERLGELLELLVLQPTP